MIANVPQFVDLEVEAMGGELRSAICHLIESDLRLCPAEIREMFEALLADIAVAHRWIANADGVWFQPHLYEPSMIKPRIDNEDGDAG